MGYKSAECKWCGVSYTPEATEDYPTEEYCSEFCWRDWMDNEDMTTGEL